MRLMPRKRGQQIDETYADGLQGGRVRAETGRGEDVVGVVEDCVDAGELVEEADRDGKQEGLRIAASEERLFLGSALEVDGVDDLLELGFGVGRAHHAENIEGFVGLVGGDEPARAARNAVKHEQKDR